LSDINRVCLSGRLIREPELKQTSSGHTVTTMRLVFEAARKVDGEWKNEPNFIDLTAWGKQGEFYFDRLSKGSLVFAEGRLAWHEWEAPDGSKRQAIKVTVDGLKSPDLFKGARQAPAPEGDDIPF
jgi:single-strand DNA-binding protein